MHIVLYILVGILLLGLGWIISAIVHGIVDVRAMPREPMAWCPKHGHFRKGYSLKLLSGAEICPQCYLEAIQVDGKVSLWRK